VVTAATADTTIGLLLNTVRELSASERYLRNGGWLDEPYPLTVASLQDRSCGGHRDGPDREGDRTPARGSVVDEKALIEALQNGTILSAGLDVFEDEPNVPQELMDMDHVCLLPHVGTASVYTRRAMGQLVVDNLLSWAEGEGPLTPVAETPWPPKSTG